MIPIKHKPTTYPCHTSSSSKSKKAASPWKSKSWRATPTKPKPKPYASIPATASRPECGASIRPTANASSADDGYYGLATSFCPPRMKTTIHNVESRHGLVKLVLFIEGNAQRCHVFRNEQHIAEFSYSKDQDIDIDLLNILQTDIARL